MIIATIKGTLVCAFFSTFAFLVIVSVGSTILTFLSILANSNFLKHHLEVRIV